MSAPTPPPALPASPARPPALAPGMPPVSPPTTSATPTTPSRDAASATAGSGNIEVVPATAPSSGANTTTTPPVRQPQQDYWDEKICLEVEYNAEYPQNTIVNDGSSGAGRDFKTPGFPASPAPGGLKRSNTSASSISEPAPAYKTGDAFANSPASERGMWRGDAGITENDRPRPQGAMILGYPKKKVIMVASGAALFIGLIIAIALGVTLGMEGKSSGSTTGDSLIADNTKMASMNWTEPGSGTSHVGVFYQAKDNSIMMSMRDSLSNRWRTINISDSVIRTTKAPALDVGSGTPLAVCTNGYQQSLYYVNSKRQIQELYTTKPAGDDEWASGVFSARVQAKVMSGGHLAATRQVCTNCSQALLVSWQDEDGSIKLANFTQATDWQQMPALSTSAAPGTGLALSVFTDFRGTGPYGTDTNALRAYMSGGSTLVEYINGPENNFVWATGNFGNALATGLSVNPSPDIASITYGNNGWSNNLVTYLDSNGGVMSAVWRGQSWSVQSAGLTGAPADITTFTSIAATQEMHLYARAKGGKIHEFTSNSTNPFVFTWQGAVQT